MREEVEYDNTMIQCLDPGWTIATRSAPLHRDPTENLTCAAPTLPIPAGLRSAPPGSHWDRPGSITMKERRVLTALLSIFSLDYHSLSLDLDQQSKRSPRRLASLTYSGTPVLKGLKDIVETLPSGLDSSAANSIMPMNKPEQKKTLLLSGALLSRRVVGV
ncbi:hypothetical protein TSUD_259860 [Trifolium subterraneum]|uniref:Uncharacterized protein n=1 Tax=Trifolium subterraneum TaxID=3900 RepID=A0A2Z6M5Y1_TRISU|nr:hypothetical protein TSUD_259860 [Trifolium subterraneum]